MNQIDHVESGHLARIERVEWVDVARGLGISLVVFGHVERGLVSAGIAAGPCWTLLDRAIYSFHMPLFMLLAGMNVPSSLAKGRWYFLKSKAWTIAYPYFLWSLIHGGIMVMASRFTNAEINFSDLLEIGWRPISPFWFLYALFVFMILTWLVHGRGLVLLIAAGLGLCYAQFDTTESLLHQISYNLIFFAAGVAFSRRLYALRFRRFVGPFFVIVWLLAFQLVPVEGRVPYLKPAAVFAGFVGIFAVMAIAQSMQGVALRHLATLGRLSMTIYVLHVIVASATRIAMVKIAGMDNPLVLVGICTLSGIYIPLFAHLIIGRLNLLGVLGLGRRRERTVRI